MPESLPGRRAAARRGDPGAHRSRGHLAARGAQTSDSPSRRCGAPRHVALTFDDGPDPVSTPRFLDALDGLGARATFFVLGDAVVRHPGVVRETVRRGHEVAVHGWSHDRPWLPAPARDVRALRRAVEAVQDVTGVAPGGTGRRTGS